jgi:hypothetical protein
MYASGLLPVQEFRRIITGKWMDVERTWLGCKGRASNQRSDVLEGCGRICVAALDGYNRTQPVSNHRLRSTDEIELTFNTNNGNRLGAIDDDE